MPSYEAPVAEVLFLLHDVFVMQRYNHLPGFADASPDTVAAILEEGGKFCSEVLTPLNRQGDIQGCTRHPDGSVSTPNGFKEAYAQLVSGGWVGLSCPPEFGGQGLPSTLTVIFNEFLVSANHSFYMYSALVQGAVMTIQTHGSDALKQKYLPKLVEGAWASTMNLTEPHCGTDLGLLRTKAVPQPDGTYKISGTKIFISGGEHDLTENIIHLVIARIEGAPAGTKGISLFIVPKIMVNDDGTLGQKNGITCGSVEHKMGIKGSATCVMNYDNAVGYLVGQENRGLAAMFVMMNDARIAVGVQSLALSEVAYQNAATYTKERLQGRALTGPKFPDKPADPILVHPDVRRTLLTIRAINEAGRAFAIWLSLFGDVAFRSRDEKEREHADDMMGLLTPVLKGALTDWGFRNTVNAQQLYGGHGYITEAGMEQFVRDARIPMIYEGANGIQALDLVRRKLPRDNGRAVRAFFDEVQSFLNAYKADEAMKPFVRPLEVSFGHLQQATTWFADNATDNPDNAGAGSTDYLHLFGLVVFGLMWGRIVGAVNEKLANGTSTNGGLEQSALKDKLIVARFFFERLLPETSLRLNRIEMGSANVMEMAMEGF